MHLQTEQHSGEAAAIFDSPKAPETPKRDLDGGQALNQKPALVLSSRKRKVDRGQVISSPVFIHGSSRAEIPNHRNLAWPELPAY